MRKQLAKMREARSRFSAKFVRYGSRSARKGTTVTTLLFCEVSDAAGDLVADHVWLTTTKAFEQISLRPGDRVSFDARVAAYEKGYQGLPAAVRAPRKVDFRLSHPTKIVKED